MVSSGFKRYCVVEQKQKGSQHWSLWHTEMHTAFPLLSFIPPLQIVSVCPHIQQVAYTDLQFNINDLEISDVLNTVFPLES